MAFLCAFAAVLLNIFMYIYVISPTYSFVEESGTITGSMVDNLERSERISNVLLPVIVGLVVLAVISLLLGVYSNAKFRKKSKSKS